MKFLCGSCRTKYQISDEKVRGKILTIRCKKCGAKILVRESLARDAGGGTAVAPVADEQAEAVVSERRSVSARAQGGGAALAHAYDEAMKGHGGEHDDMPTSIAPVPANLEIAGVEWYVAIDGEQHGPFAFPELVKKISGGEILGRHYAWHDGMENWTRVRDVKDLAGYLQPTGKKKPPPPPPPGATGDEADKVVDFAEKKAERQRQLGASAVAPMDSDLEQTEVESPEAGALVMPSTSERAEQLDHVLNEALGIAGEGQTARAEPEKAVPSAAKAKATIEDLLSFDNNQEDIFANVPRASDEADPQRESTRFFVAAAGVNKQKSRARMGLVIGLVILAGLGAFVGAWAAGIIEVKIPGIGNPFHRGDTVTDDDLAALGAEDVEDPDALKKMLEGVKDPARRKAIVQTQRRKSSTTKTTAGATNDYVDDGSGQGSGSGGPRGETGAEALALEGDLSTSGGGRGAGVGDARLPGSGIEDVVPVDQKTLSQDAITAVINARKKSVSICYEQSLRGREDLRGKLEVKVTVQPDGKVSKTSVETTAFKGSKVGLCVADKIKDWRFPSFEGEPQQIVVPFVLEKQSY
ncbi:MAG: zinc-ribbon domain-containing protein [Myxococcales bacterium]|nr:zinc-ribbon domain-containing protein [Myxococcales bacterium]